MIIKDIRTTLLELPYPEQPLFSRTYDRNMELVVVEIETADGIVGMGYVHLIRGGLRTVDACIHEWLTPVLIGQDSTYVEHLWRRMWLATYREGRMGIAVIALSALDIALWDALGKRAQMPLYRLWGGHADSVPAYGAGCWRGRGADGMIETALRYRSHGFRAIKMQAGYLHSPQEDARNVHRMREAVGEEIDIMVDVNMGWTADVALEIGPRFEECDVYWLEEPVPADDFDGYLRIARSLKLRIVGGENHFTRFDLRPFFRDPLIPILQPDVARGGLTELRKIAAVADTWGIRIAPHLYYELMVQLMASIPNGHSLEYIDWFDNLWIDPVVPTEGTVRVPERHGHGLHFKPEVLTDFRCTP